MQLFRKHSILDFTQSSTKVDNKKDLNADSINTKKQEMSDIDSTLYSGLIGGGGVKRTFTFNFEASFLFELV